MIARSSWFKRRKYGGWGVSPKTWKGWLYIIIVILLFVIFQTMEVWSDEVRIYVTIGWLSFLMLDLLPIMVNSEKSEKEFRYEAISERNAAWFMAMVLVIAVIYEIIKSGLSGEFKVNFFIVIALLGGALVKTLSNIYLDRTTK